MNVLEGHLGMLALELGKHLGDVADVLPLRTVCKEWDGAITRRTPSAALDLHPVGTTVACKVPDDILENRDRFFSLCPGVTELKYHVSPQVSLTQFAADMKLLNKKLPMLEKLQLLFNNSMQQFEQRHLDALLAFPNLRSLSILANFHPTACSFAPLAALSKLTELRILVSEFSNGITDVHVASMAALKGLEVLEFPGHAKAFTGETLNCLAPMVNLSRLSITSVKPQTAAYTLGAKAAVTLSKVIAGTTSGMSKTAPVPLHVDITVPDATWLLSVLAKAGTAPGLASLSVSIREPVTSQQIAELAALPVSAKLEGLVIQSRGMPSADDVDLLARLTSLTRLHLTSKCVCTMRSPPFDLRSWSKLRRLRHFHLHVNPAWRRALDAATVEALAAAWPQLEHLHLRLSTADTPAIAELWRFAALKQLELQWLQSPPPERGSPRRRSCDNERSITLATLPEGLRALELTSITPVHIIPAAGACGGQSKVPALLPNLESFTLDGAFDLSDELMATLCDQLQSLRSLSLVLMGRQPLTATGVGSMGRLPNLRSLLLQDYRDGWAALDQTCLRNLANAATLRELKVSTPDTVHQDFLADCFTAFRRLRKLDLVGCQAQADAALKMELPLCCMRTRLAWQEDVEVAEAVAAAAGVVPAAPAILPLPQLVQVAA